MEQLLWCILYVTHVLHGHPACNIVENKLVPMVEKAETAILNGSSQEEATRLAQEIRESNALFIAYVKHIAYNVDDSESIQRRWQENAAEMGELLTWLNPGQTNWCAMLRHSDDLLLMVIRGCQSGKFKTLTDVTPLLHRHNL